MPTNYTGNPIAIQTPATAPAFNNPVVMALPVDGDGGAASLYQSYKVLADNITLVLDALGGTGPTAGGTTAPTPAFNRSWYYKESAPFAMCVSDGTSFQSGLNILSFTRTATGSYTLKLNTSASATTRVVISGSAQGGYIVAAPSAVDTILIASYQVSTSGPTIALGNIAWSMVAYHT